MNNNADRARKIFRSANTLSFLLVVATTINLLMTSSLNNVLVLISDNFILLDEENQNFEAITLFYVLISVLTSTMRRLQVGAIKALD
jgi:hypothetical protein